VTTVARRRLPWLVPIVAAGVLVYSVISIFTAATVVYSGYDLPVLVSADGRTLTLGQWTVPCYGTVDPVAEHDATRVALLLRWTTTEPDAPCPAPWAAYPTLTLDVRLDSPLGRRALVDGETGQALPRFDARTILRPRWLPSGYSLYATTPIVPGNVPGNGSGPPPAGCVQYFQSATGAMIGFAQVNGPYDFSPPAIQPIEIRGRPGSTDSRSEVTWSENGQTDQVALAPPGGLLREQSLTVADLTAMANSAR
jgi:hypothetical protein